MRKIFFSFYQCNSFLFIQYKKDAIRFIVAYQGEIKKQLHTINGIITYTYIIPMFNDEISLGLLLRISSSLAFIVTEDRFRRIAQVSNVIFWIVYIYTGFIR